MTDSHFLQFRQCQHRITGGVTASHNKSASASMRPEDLELASANQEDAFPVSLESSTYLGNRLRLNLVTGEQRLIADIFEGDFAISEKILHFRVKAGRLTTLPPC